ncbi:MAG TPA: glycosyltransferase [Gemmatimonadaceae bacterium]|jgi:glycosyltransferase involved in cell wall biosynthesis|nr:glycosyltransferase [Gemmatimonadaceae bacterium]
MRIAITVDPIIPVPPRFYGGIERIVDFLTRGLVARGYDVSLLAHPDSDTGGKLIPYGTPPHFGARARVDELRAVGQTLYAMRNDVDVIHSFGRLAALVPVLPLRRIAKIQSYQRRLVPWRSVRIATALGGKSMLFTACSTSVYGGNNAPAGRWVTVFNGVELSRYTFRDSVAADAPLVFLGRLERIKGVHNAIEIARQSGRKLIIAGNRVDAPDDPKYFENEIVPALKSGDVEYIGAVDDMQKDAILGGAAALLMPIEWDEPFGIVMAEALACGTPVIGFARGSVPEVIRDGVTGFVVKDVSSAVDSVRNIGRLSRKDARDDCENRFSDVAIVSEYEKLYAQMSRR